MGGSVVAGERLTVTVLFVNSEDSMSLVVDRDPEDARRLLDAILDRMIEAVHRYDGTVNQVTEESLMALFGAPLAHADHAVRACRAALRMQETVGRCAEQIQNTKGISIKIRVGLSSGEVFVRSIGKDLSMEYSAVGQTTHLAAEMGQLAGPGRIFVASSTASLVGGHMVVNSLGSMRVKALADPVDVYELTGVLSAS